MSKRNSSTPTVTESRAKRTPKPNPKYAVDYVAKIRISPDRRDEDEDSESEEQLIKPSVVKKLIKATPTPEPKKPQTPIMSRLSTLRHVPKRGSPPVVSSTKTTPVSGKTTPVSAKSSPTPSTGKSTPNVDEVIKTRSSPADAKMVSSSSDAKSGVTMKRTGKTETANVQKHSPVAKTIKKGDKDEIRIVNINDIIKQSDNKRSTTDTVKPTAKKQKVEPKEVDVIDIEDEISVSSAVVRPTTRTRASALIEKAETKAKPAIVQKQGSPLMAQKKKPIVISPPNMPSKQSPTGAKTKGTPENKEQLGQVLAKRILRKVVKPGSNDDENKKEDLDKPKVKKPINPSKIKKFTTFEKWSILNFPQIQPQPARSVLCLSLIKIGNKIKTIKLPSSDWSYRITLQKINKENSEKGEVYTGDIEDCGIQEGDKGNYAPVNITFERADGTDKKPVNRSIVFQNKSFAILMEGKPCKLIGAPQYIYDLIEVQTLLHIVDKVELHHSYVDQGDK